MKYCPNDDCTFVEAHRQRASFADHVELCLDCGARLQSGDPTAAPAPSLREAKLVPLVECEESMFANGVIATLQHEGIPVFLGDKFLEPPVPPLPHGVKGYRLQVRENDVERALALLEEPAEEPDGPGEVPDFDPEDERERCPQCGGAAIETRTRKRSGLAALFMGKDDDYKVCTACNEEI
jgi:hypothetical protein